MSPSDLGVFGLDKRAAAADEASGGNASADDTVAAGWLGKGCVLLKNLITTLGVAPSR